jgi:hypothetical protein
MMMMSASRLLANGRAKKKKISSICGKLMSYRYSFSSRAGMMMSSDLENDGMLMDTDDDDDDEKTDSLLDMWQADELPVLLFEPCRHDDVQRSGGL